MSKTNNGAPIVYLMIDLGIKITDKLLGFKEYLNEMGVEFVSWIYYSGDDFLTGLDQCAIRDKNNTNVHIIWLNNLEKSGVLCASEMNTIRNTLRTMASGSTNIVSCFEVHDVIEQPERADMKFRIHNDMYITRGSTIRIMPPTAGKGAGYIVQRDSSQVGLYFMTLKDYVTSIILKNE